MERHGRALIGRAGLLIAAVAAVGVLVSCASGPSGDDFTALSEEVSGIKSEQKTVVRELESLKGEVSDLAAALHPAEGGAQAATTSHDAPATASTSHDAAASTSHGAPAAAPAAAAAHEAPHWTYEGAAGPEAWGSLAGEWSSCAAGTSQSPINIVASMPIDLTDVHFQYAPAAVTVINKGHTIQGNVAAGSNVTVDGEHYELLQFHFHAPSEHEIDGHPAAMEVHFVHRNAAGELAVIGVLYQLGEHNTTLDALWAALPHTTEDEAHIDALVLDAMFPHDRAVYRYAGSLTTPPCSEGVKWHVMTSPLSVSAEQVEAFMQIVGANARPVQPLNGRPVLADVAKG